MLYTALRLVRQNGSTTCLIARHNTIEELFRLVDKILQDKSLTSEFQVRTIDKGETFRTYDKAEAQYCALRDNS